MKFKWSEMTDKEKAAVIGIVVVAVVATVRIYDARTEANARNFVRSDMSGGRGDVTQSAPQFPMPMVQGNPGEMMFMPGGWPQPQGFDGTLKPYDKQTPPGWHGVKPVGKMPDGRPIFAQMPVYDEVPGAFVATVYYPAPDYRLPSLPQQVAVPAKGKARNAFRRKIEDDFRKCHAAQVAYEMSPEKRSEDIRNEIGKMEWENRARRVRDEAHEHRLAHINDMTRDQYLKAQKKDLKRIDNGTPHTDMFRDQQGNVWRVDEKGTSYRLSPYGNWIKED